MALSWLRGPFTVVKPTFSMEIANLNRVINDEELQTCYDVPKQRNSPADELSVLRTTSSHPDFLVVGGGLPKRLPFSRPQSSDDLVNSGMPLNLERMGFQCNGFSTGSGFNSLEDPPEMSDDEEDEEEEEENDCWDDDCDEADDVSVGSSVEAGHSELES